MEKEKKKGKRKKKKKKDVTADFRQPITWKLEHRPGMTWWLSVRHRGEIERKMQVHFLYHNLDYWPFSFNDLFFIYIEVCMLVSWTDDLRNHSSSSIHATSGPSARCQCWPFFNRNVYFDSWGILRWPFFLLKKLKKKFAVPADLTSLLFRLPFGIKLWRENHYQVVVACRLHISEQPQWLTWLDSWLMWVSQPVSYNLVGIWISSGLCNIWPRWHHEVRAMCIIP